AAWLLPLLIIGVLALAANTLAWPVSALVRRRYHAGYDLTGIDARAHRLVRIACLALLLTLIAWVVLLQLMLGDVGWIGPYMDMWIRFLQVLSLIIIPACSAIALWNVWAVLRSRRKWLAKIWSVLLAISLLAVFYVAVLFHLLVSIAKCCALL